MFTKCKNSCTITTERSGNMLGKRLKALRKEKHITQADLAEAMGVTQQAVGKWETDRSAPDPEMVRRLAEFFETTTDDVLGFAAPVHVTPSFVKTQRPIYAEHPIPVIGTVRAGYGAMAFEEDYGTEYARVKDPENYFYLLVQGNSMAPRIQDGDLALVRKQTTLENGDLGVVVYGADGEGTLKKFVKQGNTVVLQPFNPAYQAQVVSGEDLDHLYVAGKVIETKTKW